MKFLKYLILGWKHYHLGPFSNSQLMSIILLCCVILNTSLYFYIVFIKSISWLEMMGNGFILTCWLTLLTVFLFQLFSAGKRKYYSVIDILKNEHHENF